MTNFDPFDVSMSRRNKSGRTKHAVLALKFNISVKSDLSWLSNALKPNIELRTISLHFQFNLVEKVFSLLPNVVSYYAP